MAKEFETLLKRSLKRIQQHATARQALAALCLLGLLGLGGHFLYEVWPRQFTLRMSGSEVVSNRHYLSKALQDACAKRGLNLLIEPKQDASQSMARLNAGDLDLALALDADPERYTNIAHVATLPPEMLHVLVRPGIRQLSELAGKQINLNARGSEWQAYAAQALAFAGLHAGQDYLESNLDEETLMSMHGNGLPDAVVLASFVPSALASFLVDNYQYSLLELPFPVAPPQNLNWAQAGYIPAFAYRADPATPMRNLTTLGANLRLVANRNTDPRAIYILLDALYGPELAARLAMPFDERKLTESAGYPLAEGAQQFLARNHPLVSRENFDKLKSLGGLFASMASALLVALRWFRGEEVLD